MIPDGDRLGVEQDDVEAVVEAGLAERLPGRVVLSLTAAGHDALAGGPLGA